MTSLVWILSEQRLILAKGKERDSNPFFLNSQFSFQGRKINTDVVFMIMDCVALLQRTTGWEKH